MLDRAFRIRSASPPRRPRERPQRGIVAHRRRRASAPLPSWSELASGARTPRTASEGMSTFRFAALLLTVAAAVTLYVGHVHATQELASRIETARRANLELHLKRNRLQGEFDQRVSPGVVLERAHRLGLEPGLEYAFPIVLRGAQDGG